MREYRMKKNWIGKLKTNIKGEQLSKEYKDLYTDDYNAARVLIANEFFNQAAYLLIQTIEKMLRAKIFSKVNGELEFYRDKNKSHDISDGIEFLVDITGFDDLTKKGLKEQLKKQILEIEVTGKLNNTLRYPTYSEKYKSYSLLIISKEDINILVNMVRNLEEYLKGM